MDPTKDRRLGIVLCAWLVISVAWLAWVLIAPDKPKARERVFTQQQVDALNWQLQRDRLDISERRLCETRVLTAEVCSDLGWIQEGPWVRRNKQ